MLHYSCEHANLDLLKYIIENPDFDIDFNITDQNGLTPLHLACYLGHYEVVKFLFMNSKEKGIVLDVKDPHGYTPLHDACEKGHLEIVKLFLDNSISLNINIFASWKKAMRIAKREGHEDIFNLFTDWTYYKLTLAYYLRVFWK